MKNKFLIVLSVINFIFIFFVLFNYPETTVPIHYNFHGVADSFGSKWTYLFLAVIPLILSLSYEYYEKVSKDDKNLSIRRKTIPIISLLFIGINLLFTLNMIKGTNTLSANIGNYVIIAIGLLMAYLSNFLGKLYPNRTFGIRVYWTLNDETVWNKTHRLGAYTGFLGGIILIVSGIIGIILSNIYISIVGVFIGIIFTVIIPFVYSYRLYHKIHNN